ncbi:RNA methyltransferase [Paenibacillus doosanensis]|uniref:TRM11 family SAM-dependent methyltransferase n=1 Tax=Paenibacillus doosanensis TaxID=1229154 RepID=UPI00217FF0D4|nr:RNA methyltransferase [Paenibacillus doosanensis]MCS7463893.1 RNA methyltransferase [Paenibacillus doosanensis]
MKQQSARLPQPLYVYSYVCHESEQALCAMELRALFGNDAETGGAGYLFSSKAVEPSRSPFIKLRLDVLCEEDSLEKLAERAGEVRLADETFKAEFVETGDSPVYEERRAIERLVGSRIRGKAEMRRPQRRFGIACADGRWLFGDIVKGEAVWLRHNEKPQQYSTALGTRVARAVANIAVPEPLGVRAIDPCCGIGTVLLEAVSMGIDMTGSDINPLAVRGARRNLAHFGFDARVSVGSIHAIAGRYDAAVLDLPYNLCSVLSAEERLAMLESARRLAARVVVIATDAIDDAIAAAGLVTVDRCEVSKGAFVRHIMLCADDMSELHAAKT